MLPPAAQQTTPHRLPTPLAAPTIPTTHNRRLLTPTPQPLTRTPTVLNPTQMLQPRSHRLLSRHQARIMPHRWGGMSRSQGQGQRRVVQQGRGM